MGDYQASVEFETFETSNSVIESGVFKEGINSTWLQGPKSTTNGICLIYKSTTTHLENCLSCHLQDLHLTSRNQYVFNLQRPARHVNNIRFKVC